MPVCKGLVRSLISVALGSVLLLSCNETPLETEFDSVTMEDAWMLLDTYFIFRDRLPDDPHAYSNPTSLYMAANEQWTVYYPYDIARQFIAFLSTESGGMGVLLDSVSTGVVVKQVFEDSPAETAGLLAGDTITSVDGASCAGIDFADVLELISGELGEARVLGVTRGSQDLFVRVVLGTYLAPSVFTDTLDSAVAYIALTTFSNTTPHVDGSAGEFHDALVATAWAEYTIFDLRANGGGSVGQCLSIASEFVASGTAVVHSHEREGYTRTSGGETTLYGETHDTTWYTGTAGVAQQRKFHLLVDDGTASASEIVSSCLRDYRTDIMSVGSTTYGKGRAQYVIGYDFDAEEYFLEDRGLAKITFSVLEPVVGDPYDSLGITPDHVVGVGEDALDVSLGLIQEELGQSSPKTLAIQRRTEPVRKALMMLARKDSPPMAIVECY